MPHNAYTIEQVNKIINLFNQGYNPTEIAKLLGTYNTTIRRILLRNNYKLKSISETNSIIKHNPFIDLNNAKTLYWLGFLAADGNISSPDKTKKYTIDLTLQEQDYCHLLKYKLFLNTPDLKIRQYTHKKFNKILYSLRFGNKAIHNHLNSIGIVPNKSKILKLNIPITWPLLSGILDGDGYIKNIENRRNNIFISSGSKLFIDQISEFLTNTGIKHHIYHQIKSSIYNIGIYTQEHVKTFCYNIYTSNTEYLLRKYNKLGPSIKKFIDENAANSGKPKSC